MFSEKGGAEARAGVQALRRGEAEAKTKRKGRKGVKAEKENEAAAESAIVAAPVAGSGPGATEHARALCM